MNIKDKFKTKRGITVISDSIIPQGDDIIVKGSIDPSILDEVNEINESVALDKVVNDNHEVGSPTHTFYTDMFDPILDAYKYLEGDGKDEPDFSIHEVARLAITLHSLMVNHNVNTVRGIKYKDTWSKEDLSVFIRNLFETLLDFLDNGEDSVSSESETI